MKNLFTFPLDAGTYYIDSAHIGDGTFGMSYRVDEMLQGNYLAHEGLDPVVDLSQTWQTLTPELSKYINYFDDKKQLTNLSQYDFWDTPLVTATTALNRWDLEHIEVNHNSWNNTGLFVKFFTNLDHALWDGIKMALPTEIPNTLVGTPLEPLHDLPNPLYAKRTANTKEVELYWDAGLTDPVNVYYIANDDVVSGEGFNAAQPVLVTHTKADEFPLGMPLKFTNADGILDVLGNTTVYAKPVTSTTMNLTWDAAGLDLIYISNETEFEYGGFTTDVADNKPLAIFKNSTDPAIQSVWAVADYPDPPGEAALTSATLGDFLGVPFHVQEISGTIGSEAFDYLLHYYDLNPRKFNYADPRDEVGLVATFYKLYKDSAKTIPFLVSDLTNLNPTRTASFNIYSDDNGDLLLDGWSGNEAPFTYYMTTPYLGISPNVNMYLKSRAGDTLETFTTRRGVIYSDQSRTIPMNWTPPFTGGWSAWDTPNTIIPATSFTWDLDPKENYAAYGLFGAPSFDDYSYVAYCRPEVSQTTQLRAFPGRLFWENDYEIVDLDADSKVTYNSPRMGKTDYKDLNNQTLHHPDLVRTDIPAPYTIGSGFVMGASDAPPHIWCREVPNEPTHFWLKSATVDAGLAIPDILATIEPKIWFTKDHTKDWLPPYLPMFPEETFLDIVLVDDSTSPLNTHWIKVELWNGATQVTHSIGNEQARTSWGLYGRYLDSHGPDFVLGITTSVRCQSFAVPQFAGPDDWRPVNFITKTNNINLHVADMPTNDFPLVLPVVGAYGNQSPTIYYGFTDSTTGNIDEDYDTNADGNTLTWTTKPWIDPIYTTAPIEPHASETYPNYVDSATLQLGGSRQQPDTSWTEYWLAGATSTKTNPSGFDATITITNDVNDRVASMTLGAMDQRGAYLATDTEFALDLPYWTGKLLANGPTPTLAWRDPLITGDGTEWRDFGDNKAKAWPEIAPQSAKILYNMPSSKTFAPLGTKYVLPTGRYKWQVEFTYPPLSQAEFDEIYTVVHAVSGVANPFYLPLVYNGNKILWDHGNNIPDLVRFRKESIDNNTNTIIEEGLKTFLVDGFAGDQVNAFLQGEVLHFESNINGGLNTVVNTVDANVFGEVLVSIASPLEFDHFNGELIDKYPDKCIVTLAEEDFVFRRTLEGLYEVTVTFNLDKFED